MSGRLLDGNVIDAAVIGDPEALDCVLMHYKGYITKLCTSTIPAINGRSTIRVDEELRHRLESRLLVGVLAFVYP